MNKWGCLILIFCDVYVDVVLGNFFTGHLTVQNDCTLFGYCFVSVRFKDCVYLMHISQTINQKEYNRKRNGISDFEWKLPTTSEILNGNSLLVSLCLNIKLSHVDEFVSKCEKFFWIFHKLSLLILLNNKGQR